MAKTHAIRAAQEAMRSLGYGADVADVDLAPVGRVVVTFRDGTTVTLDRWLAVKIRTLLKRRWPRSRFLVMPEQVAGT